jgi:hypothetical protein
MRSRHCETRVLGGVPLAAHITKSGVSAGAPNVSRNNSLLIVSYLAPRFGQKVLNTL